MNKTNMNEIHVCFSTNDHFAPYCGVAIVSLLQNKAREDDLIIYVLYTALSEQSIQNLVSIGERYGVKIRMMHFDPFDFLDMPVPDHGKFTVEAYYYFAMPRLLPDLSRIIALDCDLLICGSLRELYDRDIDGYALGMTLEVGAKKEDRVYNSGVVLLNCEEWRRHDIESGLFRYAAKHKNENQFVDQDVLNGLLKGAVLLMETKWNHQVHLIQTVDGEKAEQILALEDDVRIIHYAGFSKPWHGVVQNALVDEYFTYMQALPWDVADKREQYKRINPAKYYWCLGVLKEQHKQRGDVQEILMLHETSLGEELRGAATDVYGEKIESFLIRSHGWEDRNPDIIIIEYHNLAIVNHILAKKGYDLQTDRRFILISEIPQGIDNQLLAAEYIEFLKEEDDR